MRKVPLFAGRRLRVAAFILVALAAGLAPRPAGGGDPSRSGKEESAWREIEPGLELGAFQAPVKSGTGDSMVRVLRIDPGRFELRLLNASAPGQGQPLPAKEWCRRNGLVAAINAAMHWTDQRTSVSLMRTRGHVNNPALTRDKTILAFDPLAPDLPPVKILDRECGDFEALKGSYGTLVQSIRMLTCKGENVWSPQPRKWSTAAIGTDGDGKVLFIHVRSPYATHDLIEILRGLPLGLSRMMYAEGGREAQLYVRGAGGEYEFLGSSETGLNSGGGIQMAWPIPNVIGVSRKPASR